MAGMPEEESDVETTEEALALMVRALHPKKFVKTYLTNVKRAEARFAALLVTEADILREMHSPSVETVIMLGLDPEQAEPYKVPMAKGVVRTTRKNPDGTHSIVTSDDMQTIEMDAFEYAKEILRTEPGIVQAMIFQFLGRNMDNYRVSIEGGGRIGGIRIGTSMVTGKQEGSIGVLGRFRRALGQ